MEAPQLYPGFVCSGEGAVLTGQVGQRNSLGHVFLWRRRGHEEAEKPLTLPPTSRQWGILTQLTRGAVRIACREATFLSTVEVFQIRALKTPVLTAYVVFKNCQAVNLKPSKDFTDKTENPPYGQQ